MLQGLSIVLSLLSNAGGTEAVAVQVFEPCTLVDAAAYDAFEPGLRLRQPRIDALGFSGEVRAADDGRIIVQTERGSAVAWYDAPAKAKLTHKQSGETRYFISQLKEGLPNSMRLILENGKIECGWPPELRSK